MNAIEDANTQGSKNDAATAVPGFHLFEDPAPVPFAKPAPMTAVRELIGQVQ
jgi:hypothetical protein